MNLADLRRFCIRRQLRVTFTGSDGIRCCINEHGASLRDGVAGWLQSEAEFAEVDQFEVTAPGATDALELDRNGLERLCSQPGQLAGERETAGKRFSLLQLQE